MQLHPSTKIFLAKLVRFGQICLDLGETWASLLRFGQNLCKFGHKWFRFGQIWLDLEKINILYPPKYLTSYGYDYCYYQRVLTVIMYVIIICLKMRYFYKKRIEKSLSAREIPSQSPLFPAAVGLVIRPSAAESLSFCQISPKKKFAPSLSPLRFFFCWSPCNKGVEVDPRKGSKPSINEQFLHFLNIRNMYLV